MPIAGYQRFSSVHFFRTGRSRQDGNDMATIKDVAKLAGVSIATVSNYINQTKPVSKELSWAIREAIDTLHYQQNLNARSLKSSTGTDNDYVFNNNTITTSIEIKFSGLTADILNNYSIGNMPMSICTTFSGKQQ